MYINNHAGGRSEPYGPCPQHMTRQCSLSCEGMPQLRDWTDNTGTRSIMSTAMVDSLGDWVCTCYLVWGTDLTMGPSTVCYTWTVSCAYEEVAVSRHHGVIEVDLWFILSHFTWYLLCHIPWLAIHISLDGYPGVSAMEVILEQTSIVSRPHTHLFICRHLVLVGRALRYI